MTGGGICRGRHEKSLTFGTWHVGDCFVPYNDGFSVLIFSNLQVRFYGAKQSPDNVYFV